MRRFILALIIVVSLGVPLSFAQTPSDPNTSVDSMTAPEPVLDNTRIQQRIETYNVSLSSSEKKRLVQRCVAAQSKISAVRAKTVAAADKRRETYHAITTLIVGIVQRLQSHDVDAKGIQNALQSVQTKTSKFEADYGAYLNALDDARLLDCQAHPDGFKAALEDARAQRKNLLADMQDVHELALTDLRDSLIDVSLTVNQAGNTEGN